MGKGKDGKWIGRDGKWVGIDGKWVGRDGKWVGRDGKCVGRDGKSANKEVGAGCGKDWRKIRGKWNIKEQGGDAYCIHICMNKKKI